MKFCRISKYIFLQINFDIIAFSIFKPLQKYAKTQSMKNEVPNTLISSIKTNNTYKTDSKNQ